MLFEIKLDDLPNDSSEATVTRAYKGVGDEIKSGEILFDLEVGKTSFSIESSYTGKVESINIKEGESVKKGDTVAVIDGVEEGLGNNMDSKGSLENLDSDITILGGGPGGYVAAIKAAKSGANVILVEKDEVGGTCLNRGCIPTKALVRTAEVYKSLQEADRYGCVAENVSLDMKKTIERKASIVNQLVEGIHYLLERHKIKLISGEGSIKDENTVVVKSGNDETIINSKNIIIATGSSVSRPPINGINSKNVITSDEALDLEILPDKMVIIGGGVIGMEFAFIFANFGVEVSVFEFFDDILISCDEDVCAEIRDIASQKGIKIYTGTRVTNIIDSVDEQCIVTFEKNGEQEYISAEKVLLAAGREPYIDGLNLENIGIKLNDNGKGIKIDAKCRTNIPSIYAIGDVTNKIQLAHVASHQGIVAVKNIMGEDCDMDYSIVPSAIFTDPEIAFVGITEKIAAKEGIDIKIGKFPFNANGKALTLGDSRGFIKIVTEKATDKVIGASIIGPHATDLIAELVLAIKNNLSAQKIAETIHAHPTTAEVVHEAALASLGGALHYIE